MLSEHIEAALAGPLTGPALEEIARIMWRAFAEEAFDWAEAERLDGLIRERQARMKAAGGAGGLGSAGGLRRASAALCEALAAARRPRTPRSPDRQASVERRRRVASSGALPPGPAGWLTEGQRAVLTVVGREAARGVPSCTWPIAKIAALAGVERTTVQGALRLARGLGLVRVRQRRRWGARSDTNVVTVEDPAWWGWLKRHPKRAADEASSSGGGGSKRSGPTTTEELRRRERGAEGAAEAPGGDREGPRKGAGAEPDARPGAGGPREGPATGG